MKVKKYFIIGMISLIVFGVLLPQPIQALFVYTPLKSYFDSHLVLLCLLVGVVQGISEECGYYAVMKKIYAKDKSKILPKWFGFGRALLHTMFDLCIVMFTVMSLGSRVIAIISRTVGGGALLALTHLDFMAIKNKRLSILVISVVLHWIMNGMVYANELELLHFSDSLFIAGYSIVVIILSELIWRYIKKIERKEIM